MAAGDWARRRSARGEVTSLDCSVTDPSGVVSGCYPASIDIHGAGSVRYDVGSDRAGKWFASDGDWLERRLQCCAPALVRTAEIVRLGEAGTIHPAIMSRISNPASSIRTAMRC